MRYLLLITALILTTSLSAQRGGDKGNRGDKIEQQRIAFITTELDLTVEEAQAFWPLYNDFQDAQKEVKENLKTEKQVGDMTEEESELMIASAMEAKKKNLDVELRFMNDLEDVLSAKKRLKLIRLEREFKKTVLRRYQKRIKRGEKQYKRMEKNKEREKNNEEKK